jgi:hypothetical protein
MKEKFGHLKRGYFKILELVKIPKDEAVTEVLARWESQRENMNEKVCKFSCLPSSYLYLPEYQIRTHRLAHIEAQVNERERVRRIENKMENAKRETENARRETENERRTTEERLRGLGWVDEDIKNLFEY